MSASSFITKEDQKLFRKNIYKLLGYRPGKLDLYVLAFTHSSMVKNNSVRESNERLEFLGDAIIDAYIAEYLFKKFPFKDEGFLTEIRSRIVKRESLNNIAIKLGMKDMLYYSKSIKQLSIFGNAFEALIGAIYLDKGYEKCGKFILNKVISAQLDIEFVVENNENFKSILYEWASKEKKELVFNIEDSDDKNSLLKFVATALIDNEIVGTGKGSSKKIAEKYAAEEVCKLLELL